MLNFQLIVIRKRIFESNIAYVLFALAFSMSTLRSCHVINVYSNFVF